MRLNIATPLLRLMETESPNYSVNVHILLKSEAGWLAAISEIKAFNPTIDIDFLAKSKTLIGNFSINDLKQISEMPSVFWISLDAKSTIESLLDLEKKCVKN